jgi:hypothetical protein
MQTTITLGSVGAVVGTAVTSTSTTWVSMVETTCVWITGTVTCTSTVLGPWQADTMRLVSRLPASNAHLVRFCISLLL